MATVARVATRFESAPAVVQHALEEIQSQGLTADNLMRGEIQIDSTVDDRVQHIVMDALEHGLAAYERRHPKSHGLIQGAVVVLRNSDAAILAEIGGRQYYKNRSSSYVDFNRATTALRQPGSAMKPVVYLAAFRQGLVTLDTPVPDEPIDVPMTPGHFKTIVNYDGEYKGMIPVRQALAESRNAVAIWLTQQMGIGAVIQTATADDVKTPSVKSRHHDAAAAVSDDCSRRVGGNPPRTGERVSRDRVGATGRPAHRSTNRRTFGANARQSRSHSTLGDAPGHGAANHPRRTARRRSPPGRYGTCARFARLAAGHGQDRHDERFPRRVVHRVHVRARRRHDRRADWL